MKRIAFLAPGAVPPLTEGRKLLVVDLAQTLRARGIEIEILDGGPAGSAGRMILRALRELRRLCRAPRSVDAVVVFPHGTFRGARAWASAWFLRQARGICSAAGIAHMPVFYSCSGLSLAQLGRRFGPALAVGRAAQGVARMHLGIKHPPQTWCSTGSGLKRLLFLCGYQNPTPRALHDVLHERGLADLLAAGNSIAAADMRLTIAIPFLRDARMRERLHAQAAQFGSALRIDLHDEVDTAALFMSHDAFVFPYRSEHSVFVPTSLLEALSIGIPVVAADHAMYRDLTVGPKGPRCSLHRVGDSEDLARALSEMQMGYEAAVSTAQSAATEIRIDWTLEKSAEELLAALNSSAK